MKLKNLITLAERYQVPVETATSAHNRALAFVDSTYPATTLPGVREPMVEAATRRLILTRKPVTEAEQVSRSLPPLCPLLTEQGDCPKTKMRCPALTDALARFDYEVCRTYVVEQVERLSARTARKTIERLPRLLYEARLDGSGLSLKYQPQQGTLILLDAHRPGIGSQVLGEFQVADNEDAVIEAVAAHLRTIRLPYEVDPLWLFEDPDQARQVLAEGNTRPPRIEFVSAAAKHLCLRVDGQTKLYEASADPYVLARRYASLIDQKKPLSALRLLAHYTHLADRPAALEAVSRNTRYNGHTVSPDAAYRFLLKKTPAEGDAVIQVRYNLDEGTFYTDLVLSGVPPITVRGLSLTRAHAGTSMLEQALQDLGFRAPWIDLYRTPESRTGTVQFSRDNEPVWR